ncbi:MULTISPECIES: alpha/beta hydrolase [Streptomyces]|uniref:alpha/beta hydrolase n=1 Tax=Streptomyces TaxID=1883 RepID=UPI00031599D4|nr:MULTISPECIES: alpha/beta hydrolase [Streptomyces]WTD25618.1 alpha/beta hydrolase family protein [Streptomyces anulatus]
MDYTALKALRPSEFEQAADGYRATGDMAQAAKDHIDNVVAAGMRKSLEGEAADAAHKQLQALSKNFHYTQIECGVISAALNGFAYDMAAPKRTLEAALADAHAESFTVNSDGSVTYPAGPEKVDGKIPAGGTASGTTDSTAQGIYGQAALFDPNPHFGRAQAIASRIARALKEATAADEKWAPKLRALKADDDLTVSDRDWADVGKDMRGVRQGAGDYLDTLPVPPKDGGPADNASWWKGLTNDQRADYIAMQPASVGAMGGLPADVRDEANRAVFAETRGNYQSELDRIRLQEPPRYVVTPQGTVQSGKWKEWDERYGDRAEFLDGRLDGIEAIQERFDDTGTGGLPAAYLLGFAPEANHDGRVILANGNPDTADHTAVFVPGTKTVMDKIGEEMGQSEMLWGQAQAEAPDQSVSTIVWFDYDAPNTIPDAVRAGYATDGGATLRHFLEGNDVAHQVATGDHAHRTVIGHSYGSTVVGEATQYTPEYSESKWMSPTPADDIIAVGSPGMQVSHAAGLGMKQEHVWAMGGGGDDLLVRVGGKYVGLGDEGNIPTDPEFGANIMDSDAGNHGAFWDAGENGASLSLRNQARVIVGAYGNVALKDE